jgi:hypothetical protein
MPSPLVLALAALAGTAGGAAASYCSFCAHNGNGQAVTFDLSGLPTATFEWSTSDGVFDVTTPCGQVSSTSCGRQNDPFTQSCKGVGDLSNITVALTSGGFDLTLHNGFDDPPMPQGRNAAYHFICDNGVPVTNPPNFYNITESPPGFYNVYWHTPAACGVVNGTTCGPVPPVPPPVPPPTPCTAGSDVCIPTWTPTYAMRNSTVLYTCNVSGYHSPEIANLYGVVVYVCVWRGGGGRGGDGMAAGKNGSPGASAVDDKDLLSVPGFLV